MANDISGRKNNLMGGLVLMGLLPHYTVLGLEGLDKYASSLASTELSV